MESIKVSELENTEKINKDDLIMIIQNKKNKNIKFSDFYKNSIIELLTVSEVAPEKCNINDKYYNTATSKIYTAIAENVWGTNGETPSNDVIYIDLEHKELYYCDDTGFSSYGGGLSGGDSFPIGAIVPFSSDTIPANWILCDGRAVSRTEYSGLFNVLGTKFGTGDGSTTFCVPNLKGRTVVGKQPTDPDFKNVGQTGGSKFIQDHWHGYSYGSSAGGDGSGLVFSSTEGTQLNKSGILGVQGPTTGNSGNLQPYFTVNFIIKAKMSASLEGQVIDSLEGSSTIDAPSVNAVKEALKTNIITGTAVATNEYIDGKQVYVKRISFTMSSTLNSWQIIDTLTNYGNLDEMHGSLTTGGEDITFPTAQSSNEVIKVYIDPKSGEVKVWHTYSYVNGKSCSLTIRYTLK